MALRAIGNLSWRGRLAHAIAARAAGAWARRPRHIGLALVAASLLAGCNSTAPPTSRPTTRLAATQANEPPEAYLALDEIQPRPDLAELAPTTKPTTEPSLDAIELYARARGELGD